MDQYLAAEHIHLSSRRRGQGHIDLVLTQKGLSRKIALRIQNSRAAPNIVQQTNLLLTIPKSLAQGTTLQILELPFELPKLDWHLYWAKNYENDKAHIWMRELIFDIFDGSMT